MNKRSGLAIFQHLWYLTKGILTFQSLYLQNLEVSKVLLSSNLALLELISLPTYLHIYFSNISRCVVPKYKNQVHTEKKEDISPTLGDSPGVQKHL